MDDVEEQLDTGSAPRVRGTEDLEQLGEGDQRFSPACAGNGVSNLARAMMSSVQPRVCGERSVTADNVALPSGSAPRVRGTERGRDAAYAEHRFSPACAGNGMPSAACITPASVQPRVCGERYGQVLTSGPMFGSAPRVRGTD